MSRQELITYTCTRCGAAVAEQRTDGRVTHSPDPGRLRPWAIVRPLFDSLTPRVIPAYFCGRACLRAWASALGDHPDA